MSSPPDVVRLERDRDEQGRAENQRPRDRFGRPLPYDTDEIELAEEWEYDTVEQALAIGHDLWDRQRFFEAHECLEDVWHNSPEADRRFWQGVIQVAVGCCHHQRGNHRGASTLLDRAAEKLAEYPDVHHGLDVEQLRVFCEGAVAAMADAGFAVEVGYPELPVMDDGPWFDRDAGPHPLPEGPAWEVAAADRRARSTDAGRDPGAS